MRLLSLLLISLIAASPALAEVKMKYRGFAAVESPIGVAAIPFADPNGNQVTIGAWQGKWLLLNVWATWCAPCVAELPNLQKLALTHNMPQLSVAAVNVDRGKTNGEINAFLAEKKIGGFAGYMDNTRALQTALRSKGIPMSYLIDPNGRIVATYRGAANWVDPMVYVDLKRWIKAGTTSNTSPTYP